MFVFFVVFGCSNAKTNMVIHELVNSKTEPHKLIICVLLIALKHLRGSKLGDRLTSQIVGDLTLAKRECCFCIPAGRKKQVIGTSPYYLEAFERQQAW